MKREQGRRPRLAPTQVCLFFFVLTKLLRLQPTPHPRLRPRNRGRLRCVSVPDHPPVNVSAALNGTEVLLTWEGPPGKLNGELQGYVVEYGTPGTRQVGQGHGRTGIADTRRRADTLPSRSPTGGRGRRLGHGAVGQSVRPPVQRLLSSVCLYRGRARPLDPHADPHPHRTW